MPPRFGMVESDLFEGTGAVDSWYGDRSQSTGARAYSWIRETWLIWSECQCYGLSWQLEPRAWCRVPFSSNPVSGRQF